VGSGFLFDAHGSLKESTPKNNKGPETGSQFKNMLGKRRG